MKKHIPELLHGNELPKEYIEHAKQHALPSEKYATRYADLSRLNIEDDDDETEQMLENRQKTARNFLAMEIFHKKDILTKFTSQIILDDMELHMLVEAFCTGVRMITQEDAVEVKANIKACKKILPYVNEVLTAYGQSYGDTASEYFDQLQQTKDILIRVLTPNT